MPQIDDLIKALPDSTQETARALWDKLPQSERDKTLSFFKQLPVDSRLFTVINLLEKEVKTALGKENRIAIVGPANVGKSTLFNQLITDKNERAAVSPVPGTTRQSQESSAALFSIIDTPGADAVGNIGEEEKQRALASATQADFLIILFAAQPGIEDAELKLFHQFVALGKPYLLVLNKIDLIKSEKEKQQVIQHIASTCGLKPEEIIPIVATSGKNVEKIILAIARAKPEITAALGSALPKYRWQLAWQTTISAATAAGLIGLIPLPIVDFIPLISTQIIMITAIARIYNYKITFARVFELAVTFGLGFLGRTLFYELSKLGGVPGWVLAAAIAASTTMAMGYAAAMWFGRGEKVNRDTLKRITSSIASQLIKSMKELGKRKPGRKKLKDRLAEELENISFPGTPGQQKPSKITDPIIDDPSI